MGIPIEGLFVLGISALLFLPQFIRVIRTAWYGSQSTQGTASDVDNGEGQGQQQESRSRVHFSKDFVVGSVIFGPVAIFALYYLSKYDEVVWEGYSGLYVAFLLIVAGVALYGLYQITKSTEEMAKYVTLALFGLIIVVIIIGLDRAIIVKDWLHNVEPSHSGTAAVAPAAPEAKEQKEGRDRYVIEELTAYMSPSGEYGPEKSRAGTCLWTDYVEDQKKELIGTRSYDLQYVGKNYDTWIPAMDYWKLARKGKAPFDKQVAWKLVNNTDKPLAVIVKIKRAGTC